MTKISNQYSLTNVLTADTTNGRVGINNASPTVALDVTGAGKFSGAITANIGSYNPSFIAIGSSTGNGQIQFSGSSNYSIGAGTDFGGMGLYVGGAYRTYILNNGNVGIGTSSPATQLDVRGTPSADWGNLTLFDTRTATAGQGGVITFSGYKTSTTAANIFAKIAGGNENGNGTENGYLSFITNTGSAYAERMRITSGGNVCIGTTNTSGNLSVKSLSSGIAVNILGRDLSDGAGVINFMNQYATTLGVIECNTNAIYVIRGTGGVYLGTNSTSWTSNSDSRLKNIISPINNALDKLNALNAVIYSWKSDDTNKENIGLIAQDVESVFPQVIDTNKDGFLGVRYTELVPVLVAAIKEQQTQINELKALINA